MISIRDFPCSTLSNEDNDLEDAETECDEVEVVSQKINKQLVKKSTVAKASLVLIWMNFGSKIYFSRINNV